MDISRIGSTTEHSPMARCVTAVPSQLWVGVHLGATPWLEGLTTRKLACFFFIIRVRDLA